jgi:hypothetical protein
MKKQNYYCGIDRGNGKSQMAFVVWKEDRFVWMTRKMWKARLYIWWKRFFGNVTVYEEKS